MVTNIRTMVMVGLLLSSGAAMGMTPEPQLRNLDQRIKEAELALTRISQQIADTNKRMTNVLHQSNRTYDGMKSSLGGLRTRLFSEQSIERNIAAGGAGNRFIAQQNVANILREIRGLERDIQTIDTLRTQLNRYNNERQMHQQSLDEYRSQRQKLETAMSSRVRSEDQNRQQRMEPAAQQQNQPEPQRKKNTPSRMQQAILTGSIAALTAATLYVSLKWLQTEAPTTISTRDAYWQQASQQDAPDRIVCP